GPRQQEDVALAGRKAHDLGAETGQVVVARHRAHELDGAAGGPEREGAERVARRPVFQVLELRGDPAFSDHVHWSSYLTERVYHRFVTLVTSSVSPLIPVLWPARTPPAPASRPPPASGRCC